MARSPVYKLLLGSGKIQEDISGRVTSFTYKRSITHDDTVDITLEDADADWLLEQPCCYSGSPLTFSYGFLGETLSDPITLPIGDIEPDYSGNKNLVLTISSVDASQAMKKLRSNKIWKDMRVDQIIQGLAEIHGIDAEIQTFISDPKSQEINLDQSTNRKADSTTNAELQSNLTQTNPTRLSQYKNATKHAVMDQKPVPFATHESFPQGWVSNHHFLQTMTSAMGLGFISYVSKGVLHFVQKGTAGVSTDTIVKGVTDGLMGFKVKYKEITGKGSEEGVGTQKFDPKSTETILMLGRYHLIASNGVISRLAEDGSRQVLARGEAEVDGTVVKNEVWYTINEALKAQNVTNISPDDIDKYLMGQQRNAAINQSIEERFAIAQEGIQEIKDSMLTANLREQGNISREINTIITMAGFATRYNGNWFIEAVTDTIDASGFITSSELHRGETRSGVVPTEAANNTEGSPENKRVVNVNGGWDYPAGVNPNNPTGVPGQTTVTSPSDTDKKVIIKQR